MSKISEINYIQKVCEIENINVEDFITYLRNKPYSDLDRARYLMDISQILYLLPDPPAKILDVGVGSGWTSDIYSKCGYEVFGVDISVDMVNIAKNQNNGVNYLVHDFEEPFNHGEFDAAIIYDSLHHALDPQLVFNNLYMALKMGGIIITIEPGQGHQSDPKSLEIMHKYGTTEKDMPFSLQEEFALSAGFRNICQHLRFSQISLDAINSKTGYLAQLDSFTGLLLNSIHGTTTVVTAQKPCLNEITRDIDLTKIPFLNNEPAMIAEEIFKITNHSSNNNLENYLSKDQIIKNLHNLLAEAELDRHNRGTQIDQLTNLIKKIEVDSLARYEQIVILTEQLKKSQAENNDLLDKITLLTAGKS